LGQLNDFIAFKRAFLTQLLLVASIFGAFSISGVVALMVGERWDQLRSFLFATLCLSSIAFLAAASLDAILLPAMGRNPPARNAAEANTLLSLGDAAIWSVLIGASLLMVAIGGFGFAFSKRMGWFVAIASGLAAAGIAAGAVHLARALG
jgi:hypothetical protein